ncbi:MATE family efflux transporter [Sphingomonas montana]|uniref:MATE family efflux transporter n=1 Tax=Sphingomonas montana TaxID=1843236 RepID=UPI00096DC7F6|nr:MATE family efflux transporter [Sphingomonas montana]
MSSPVITEIRATLALAAPLVLTNVAQAAINATDVALLGLVGPDTLAAGALGVNLITACLFFGTGVVTASSPMLSRALGARPHAVRDVRRTVRQALWSAVVLAVPFWLILWHAGAILVAFGQDPALSRAAQGFVRATMWGLLPAYGFLVLRSFMAAVGRPGWTLVIAALAVLVNAGINAVLIFGAIGIPPLGLVGAGIGSAIANTLMFGGLAAVTVVDRRFRRYRLFGRWWRSDWSRFTQLWRLGLPIAVTLTLEVTVFNAAVFLMGLLGTASLAAHAIAIQIAALSFMVPLGMAQAVTVRVGLASGRGDRAAVARAGWTTFGLTTGFMCLMAAVLLAVPRLLVSAFLDVGDPANAEVVTLAVSFLAIAALFQVVDGAQAVGAGMLRGLHDTAWPMAFALFGYWVIGLGVGVWLGFHQQMGGMGVWIGLASGLAVVAVLMMVRWARRETLGLA